MKKRPIPAWVLARDASQILFGVVVTLTVLLLLFLAFFVAKTLTSKLISKQNLPPVVISQENLPPPPLPIGILRPREGETVSGVVPVTLSNPSGRNYQRLEFWVDRQLEKKFDAAREGLADKLFEVNYRLDSRKFSDGEHYLGVRAVDMEGRYQTFSVKVNFTNRTALKSQ